MEQYKYIVISFKPSHQDVCKGCIMDTYFEDFRMSRFLRESEVVDYLVSIENNHRKDDCGNRSTFDVPYKHWVMTSEQIFGNGEFDPIYEVEESNGFVPEEIWSQVEDKLNHLKNKKEEEKTRIEKEKKRNYTLEVEAKERAELARLQAKYKGT